MICLSNYMSEQLKSLAEMYALGSITLSQCHEYIGRMLPRRFWDIVEETRKGYDAWCELNKDR